MLRRSSRLQRKSASDRCAASGFPSLAKGHGGTEKKYDNTESNHSAPKSPFLPLLHPIFESQGAEADNELATSARPSSIEWYQNNPEPYMEQASPQTEILLGDETIMGTSLHATHEYKGVEFESASAPENRLRLEIGPIPDEYRADTLIKTRIRIISPSSGCKTSATDYQSVLMMNPAEAKNWEGTQNKTTLRLFATVGLATSNRRIVACAECVQREIKKNARSKSKARIGSFDSLDNASPIVFATRKLRRLEQGEADMWFKIICYCSHQEEKIGFRVHIILKDHRDSVVGYAMTDPIMIVDRKRTKKIKDVVKNSKNAIAKINPIHLSGNHRVQIQMNAPAYLPSLELVHDLVEHRQYHTGSLNSSSAMASPPVYSGISSPTTASENNGWDYSMPSSEYSAASTEFSSASQFSGHHRVDSIDQGMRKGVPVNEDVNPWMTVPSTIRDLAREFSGGAYPSGFAGYHPHSRPW